MVSSGPPPVTIPDLGGHGLDEVAQILAGIGLKVGSLTPEYDETWPKDIVLGTLPGTPAQLPKGPTVPLRVSNGPKPRTIPARLSGWHRRRRSQPSSRRLGLIVAYSEAYSPTVAEGTGHPDQPAGRFDGRP